MYWTLPYRFHVESGKRSFAEKKGSFAVLTSFLTLNHHRIQFVRVILGSLVPFPALGPSVNKLELELESAWLICLSGVLYYFYRPFNLHYHRMMDRSEGSSLSSIFSSLVNARISMSKFQELHGSRVDTIAGFLIMLHNERFLDLSFPLGESERFRVV